MATRRAVGAVLLGNIAALMGMVPIATILPTVAEYFGQDIQTASFVMTAFLLMIAALVLIAGRLGDLIGFQRVYRAGLVLYALGALLSGLALEFWQLVAARGVAGIGAALLTGTSAAMITAVVDPARRGRALSLLTITGPIGGIIGVSLAPLLLDTLSWRWVFFMIVPLALGAFVLARHVPVAPLAAGRHVDALGGAVLFGALVAFSLSFNHFHEGGETFEDGWAWHIPMQVLATAALLPYVTFGTFLAIQVVLGLGMGVANTLNYTIALSQAPSDQRGFVTGLLETTRQMGHTMAVVLAAAVLGAAGGDGGALVPGFQLAWLVFGLIAAGGAVLAVLPQRTPRVRGFQSPALGPQEKDVGRKLLGADG